MDNKEIVDWMDCLCLGTGKAYSLPLSATLDGTEWVIFVYQPENSSRWEAIAYEYHVFCCRFLHPFEPGESIVYDTEQECAIAAFRGVEAIREKSKQEPKVREMVNDE